MKDNLELQIHGSVTVRTSKGSLEIFGWGKDVIYANEFTESNINKMMAFVKKHDESHKDLDEYCFEFTDVNGNTYKTDQRPPLPTQPAPKKKAVKKPVKKELSEAQLGLKRIQDKLNRSWSRSMNQ